MLIEQLAIILDRSSMYKFNGLQGVMLSSKLRLSYTYDDKPNYTIAIAVLLDEETTKVVWKGPKTDEVVGAIVNFVEGLREMGESAAREMAGVWM